MKIRKADINDVEKMLEIYNYEVVNGVATLDIKPKTLEEWTVWFNKHSNNHPIIVAENDEVSHSPAGNPCAIVALLAFVYHWSGQHQTF